MTPASRILWGRILVAAIVLEVAITAVVTPFGFVFGNPLNPPAGGQPVNTTPYLVSAAAGCAGLGYIFGWWVARRAPDRRALHGALVGVTATLIYFGLCSLAPGGIAAVAHAYSVAVYVLLNILRVGGAWAGGVSADRPAAR